MPEERDVYTGDERWGRFRFGVVGALLAAPPEKGRLQEELKQLSQKHWRHPISGKWLQFGASTIERWYYRALGHANPVKALSRKIREDCGTYPSLSATAKGYLHEQYREHPNWSYQLHADNVAAWLKEHPEAGPKPLYGVVCRYMKSAGLIKRRRLGRGRSKGVLAAEARFEAREIRSFESEYVNGLWHLDFHTGSIPVLLSNGKYQKPHLLAILDDHSRLCCHAQWYLGETAEDLVHGTSQAFEKRGLSRQIMSDNGSAMVSAEFTQGLERLSVDHKKTLPKSPYQNGKQEVFFGQVEGRLLAMLSGCKDLSLARLNEATLAWIEMEYNRKRHSALKRRPLDCFLQDRDVGRPCPSSDQLREAFTAQAMRIQRRSDGTISLQGTRFELPSAYRHLRRVCVRYSSWDLSVVHMANERTGQVLCRIYPVDKHKNADGRRRRKQPVGIVPEAPPSSVGGMAPLLRQYIAEYAATGLPPAYLPKDEISQQKEKK